MRILGALIPVFLSVTPQAFADPKHCYSYSECYNIGYGHRYADGQGFVGGMVGLVLGVVRFPVVMSAETSGGRDTIQISIPLSLLYDKNLSLQPIILKNKRSTFLEWQK